MGELRPDTIDLDLDAPVHLGISTREWSRLPPRARLLINTGSVSVKAFMADWRAAWRKIDEKPIGLELCDNCGEHRMRHLNGKGPCQHSDCPQFVGPGNG